jgi:Glycosyl hydrolases family 31
MNVHGLIDSRPSDSVSLTCIQSQLAQRESDNLALPVSDEERSRDQKRSLKMKNAAFMFLFLSCSPDVGGSLNLNVNTINKTPEPPRYTPRWAFEPWISKDISTGPDTFDFVAGFKSRNIPVGVVVLDSPWETNYHSFIPNPTRYPDFANMVANLKSQNVRTVMWMTANMNNASFDAEPGGDTYVGPAPMAAMTCGGRARGPVLTSLIPRRPLGFKGYKTGYSIWASADSNLISVTIIFWAPR